MTGPTSTFPAAKASLLAMFQASADLFGVTVDYGDPGISRIQREHLFMGGTGRDGRTWAPYGRLQIDEQYGIELYVHVAIPGGTQQEATVRACALFDAAAAVIRPLARTSTQVAPGVYGIDCQQLTVTEFVTDEGHACLVSGEIGIKARI